MKTNMLNNVAFLVLATVVIASLGGCSYMMYLFQPPEKMVTIEPQYAELEGKAVAVVIWADQRIQYEYPWARLSLSSHLQAEFINRIDDIVIVDPRRVITYQDENIRWDMLPKTTLGKKLNAEYVLLIVPDTYSMREPGTIKLFRGEISAQAALYDTSLPEAEAMVWRGDDFRVLYPPNAPTGQPDVDGRRIRHETERIFAFMVVKNFYEHKVPQTQWEASQDK